jgi:hypothetical protein
MIDRQHFLIGAGALLTASFVRRASAFSQKVGELLILPSARHPEETLYVYLQDYAFDENDEVAEYDAKWRVSLGPDQPFERGHPGVFDRGQSGHRRPFDGLGIVTTVLRGWTMASIRWVSFASASAFSSK